MQVLISAALSALFVLFMVGVIRFKKLPVTPSLHLFFYGLVLAVIFTVMESLVHSAQILFLVSVIAFEFVSLVCEEHVHFLHHKIKGDLAALGLLGYLFIGLGFAYVEAIYSIIEAHSLVDTLAYLPFRTIFAATVHSLLSFSTGIAALGQRLWTVFHYYAEIAYVGLTHFLYIFFTHHHLAYLLVPVLVLNFFILKDLLPKMRGLAVMPEGGD